MSDYSFTYELPNNLKESYIKMLVLNDYKELAASIDKVDLYYEDLGNAYYAGVRGNNWNKNALDIVFEGDKTSLESLKTNKELIKKTLERLIKPSTSGYLIRHIDFVITSENDSIELPKNNQDDYALLSKDIESSLSKGEPVLALDRLHTYSTKLFRNLCKKYGIQIADPKGDFYPLHNLIGSLAKEYENKKKFKSEFSKSAMKMSISLFEQYNVIRNKKSLAHDNDVLDNNEAEYVVKTMMNLIVYIDKIENYYPF